MEDASCSRCGSGTESIIHCLYSCPFARQIWALSDLSFSCYCCDSTEIEDWFCQVKRRTDSKEFGFFTTLCWWIWFCRNKLLWEDSDTPPLILVILAQRCFAPQVINRSSAHWLPPPRDFEKLNIDAAVMSKGAGIRAFPLLLPLNPEAAKAITALQAVQFAIESRWSCVYLERDCSNVINGITNREASLGSLGAVFEEIKVIGRNFLDFRARHVVRECNRVAHSLARLASQSYSFDCCLPSMVSDIVISEYP
ncbi:hypothetical protein ACJIZ3_021515 [Penstemon smallii]|uniref:RNase H type-1 domain-containing protein n=1 Tax=Penstemon smallii TaxID=265156 RepID=A0ABD3SLN0_9LAMI